MNIAVNTKAICSLNCALDNNKWFEYIPSLPPHFPCFKDLMPSLTSLTSITGNSMLFLTAIWLFIVSCRLVISCLLFLDVLYWSSYLANSTEILALLDVVLFLYKMGMAEQHERLHSPPKLHPSTSDIASHEWPAQIFLISGGAAHKVMILCTNLTHVSGQNHIHRFTSMNPEGIPRQWAFLSGCISSDQETFNFMHGKHSGRDFSLTIIHTWTRFRKILKYLLTVYINSTKYIIAWN